MASVPLELYNQLPIATSLTTRDMAYYWGNESSLAVSGKHRPGGQRTRSVCNADDHRIRSNPKRNSEHASEHPVTRRHH